MYALNENCILLNILGFRLNNVSIKSKLQHLSPPGKPREFELLKIRLFKFPAPRAKMVFKCPTLWSDLSVKSAPPKEQSSSAPVVTI